ncbi:MAG: transporter [Gammaproteobacteria bacterium]|nr:transporter [Gammaproteobacteria bacterium]
MEEMLAHVSTVILPVLLCALAGFALARCDVRFDKKTVGAIVANVGYPALVIGHLSKAHVALDAFLDMLLAAFAVVVCYGVIGFGIVKAMRLPVRGYVTPMMLTNVGNVGLPVCALAFGAEGLAYAMAFVVVMLVGAFTVGMWLPMGRITATDILKKPVIYAVVVALVMLGNHVSLPAPVARTFDYLGALAIPLMLLTLGHTLATLKTAVLWRGFYLAVLHLLMAGAVAYVLADAFDFSGTARGVFILQCLMPVSVVTFLWVETYDPDDGPAVAGFILVSTLLAMAVLPLALTFWI